MEKYYKNKKLRLLVGIGVPAGALLIAAVFFLLGTTPPCVFYELTGLYCAGCGSGRCFLAIMRLEFYAAFRYQPLLFVSLPFLAYYIAKLYLGFVFGKDVLPFPEIKSKWVGIAIVAVIIAYWVLRNIPVFPFNLLAPTAV